MWMRDRETSGPPPATGIPVPGVTKRPMASTETRTVASIPPEKKTFGKPSQQASRFSPSARHS
jgi:hypothetical protein